MMKLTKTGIGLLTRQYRAVLCKCLLINAGLFFVFTPNVAEAVDVGTFSYSKATIGITDLEPSGSVSGWNGQKSVAIRNHINADNITRALIHTTEIAYHTISQDKTIVQNLEALDALIGAYPSYNGMYTFANGAFLAQAKENNIGVQSMDTGASVLQNLVQLDFVVGSLQNGTYISRLKSMGDNVKALDTAVAGKQATLTTAQLNAANSGITSTKVSAYDGYADTIATKATLDEVREINDLNNYYTKYELGGKNEGKNAGNVPCHLEGLSTSERPVKIYSAKMRSENILSSLFVPMRSFLLRLRLASVTYPLNSPSLSFLLIKWPSPVVQKQHFEVVFVPPAP